MPVRQRATVSGWVGMPYAVGLVLGTLLAVEVLGSSVTASYNAFAILMFVLAVPFALTTRDPVLEPEHRLLVSHEYQGKRAEQRRGQRPPVPPAAQ